MSKRKRARKDEGSRLGTIKKKARSEGSPPALPDAVKNGPAPEAAHEQSTKEIENSDKLELEDLDRSGLPDTLSTPTRVHKNNGSPSTSVGVVPGDKALVTDRATATNGAEGDGPEPLTNSDPSEWKISNVGGGYLLDLDPVFSTDDEFLLLARRSCVQVYARATSLHVRSLNVTKGADPGCWVTGFKIPERHPNWLYISLKNGLMELWDWKEGTWLGRWQSDQKVLGLETVAVRIGGEPTDVVFTIESKDSKYLISGRLLQHNDGGEAITVRTLFRTSEPISAVRILEGGQCVVACLQQKLIVGLRKGKKTNSLKDMNYEWYDLVCLGPISAFDARTYRTEPDAAQPSKTIAAPFDIDVVVGCSDGPMFLYRSLLQAMELAEKRVHTPFATQTTKLHWHRNKVATVKWSLDGNYLISGGLETVLVLWQLDTGRRQTLPHLGAAIEAVSVSGNGASYAIRLADNSAMVISTHELQPTTHVPGILMAPQDPTVGVEGRGQILGPPASMGPTHRRPAVTASKRKPFSILLAAPATVSSSADPVHSSSQPYLQTFDPANATRSSKQALTWTNITDRNVGPEDIVVNEPHVVFIETSHDGQWLASVEEWAAPFQDLETLVASKSSIEARRKRQMETVLKFWSWTDESMSWELVSKIDNPHEHAASEYEKASFVMDLCSDPSATRFLTVGNDGAVRLWRSRQRTRGAIVVKGEDAEPLMSWTCQQSTTLPGYEKYSGEPHRNALRGALSGDGSLIAVASHCEPSHADPISLLHLIDTAQGALLSTRSGIFSGPVADIGFLDSTLILLSGQLLVWDLVADAPRYVVDLRAGAQLRSVPRTFHLQLDRRHGTFAVAVPTAKSDAGRRGAYLAVFDPRTPAPLFATPMPRPVRALAAAENARTYFAIDAHAEVYRVQAPLALPAAPPPTEPRALAPPAIRGLEQLYGSAVVRSRSDGPATGEGPSESGMVRDTRHGDGSSGLAYVTQDQLRKLWGHYDPLRLPPMEKLFEEVAALVSGMPS